MYKDCITNTQYSLDNKVDLYFAFSAHFEIILHFPNMKYKFFLYKRITQY